MDNYWLEQIRKERGAEREAVAAAAATAIAQRYYELMRQAAQAELTAQLNDLLYGDGSGEPVGIFGD